MDHAGLLLESWQLRSAFRVATAVTQYTFKRACASATPSFPSKPARRMGRWSCAYEKVLRRLATNLLSVFQRLLFDALPRWHPVKVGCAPGGTDLTLSTPGPCSSMLRRVATAILSLPFHAESRCVALLERRVLKSSRSRSAR